MGCRFSLNPSNRLRYLRDFRKAPLLFFILGQSALVLLLGSCQILQSIKFSKVDPNLSVTHTPDPYINRLLPQAKRISREYGIPIDLTLSIAIQETGYGKYVIGQNNHFGLKCKSNDCVTVPGSASTARWENCTDATLCFDTFAKTIDRLAKNDNFEDLRKIRRAGYATSPEWTQKVSTIRQSVRDVLQQARKTS